VRTTGGGEEEEDKRGWRIRPTAPRGHDGADHTHLVTEDKEDILVEAVEEDRGKLQPLLKSIYQSGDLTCTKEEYPARGKEADAIRVRGQESTTTSKSMAEGPPRKAVGRGDDLLRRLEVSDDDSHPKIEILSGINSDF